MSKGVTTLRSFEELGPYKTQLTSAQEDDMADTPAPPPASEEPPTRRVRRTAARAVEKVAEAIAPELPAPSGDFVTRRQFEEFQLESSRLLVSWIEAHHALARRVNQLEQQLKQVTTPSEQPAAAARIERIPRSAPAISSEPTQPPPTPRRIVQL